MNKFLILFLFSTSVIASEHRLFIDKVEPAAKPIPNCNPFLKVQPVVPCKPIDMNLKNVTPTETPKKLPKCNPFLKNQVNCEPIQMNVKK